MKALSAFTAILVLTLLPNHPGLANYRFSPAPERRPEFNASTSEEIPTVAFCEMVKNPTLYFDKTVRVSATLGLATEAAYLSDESCVLSHDDQIGVGYVSANESQRDLLNAEVRKIRSIEYGSRAKVIVVGTLRNSSRRSFAWYRYRFDVSHFENIAHVIIPYEGTLQAGITYRAAIRGTDSLGLSFSIPLRMPNEDYAVRIKWPNLKEFPALSALNGNSGEQQIVFSVISDKLTQLTERRWNRTIICKLIRVE